MQVVADKNRYAQVFIQFKAVIGQWLLAVNTGWLVLSVNDCWIRTGGIG
jgi:hypothetical protein